MNISNTSKRLSAQMQFKSLLLLTLLAGNAPAQQATMPPLALEIPGVSAFSAVPTNTPPGLSWTGSPTPGLDTTAVPSLTAIETNNGSSRSTWTLRQHATWLLGLKPRQVTHSSIETVVPQLPPFELQPCVAALPELPDMSRDGVMLVQHTEPTVPPQEPTLIADSSVVMAAGQSAGDAASVAHAHQAEPHGLNLRPVVSGPVPALPIEAMAAESLLQVDVSGVDPTKLADTAAQSESLIDSFNFRPPTGFSMSDSETASLAASPSHAKPVSIHEGFAPRKSSANQAAQLTEATGPIHNRLSDQEAVEENEADRTEKVYQKIVAKKSSSRPVEKSFSDKNALLASAPVEVSNDRDKTSRSRQLEVLTPPSRLAKDSAKALPLSNATPIASTGLEDKIPARQTSDVAAKLTEVKPAEVKPAEVKPAEVKPTEVKTAEAKSPTALATALVGKPPESLIDGIVPPTLLSAVTDAQTPSDIEATETAAPEAAAPIVAAAPVLPTVNKPAELPAPTIAKSNAAKPAEKLTLSDVNPIAMKRTVVKAANVAIPETSGLESSVVQSSHELDDSGRQLAEYAKMAAKMQQALKQKFPNCRVKITCNEDGLIADGHVANNTEASKVLSFVRKTSLCPVADRITTSQ